MQKQKPWAVRWMPTFCRQRLKLHRQPAFWRKKPAKQVNNLAVIGFSLGAYYALDLSNADPEHIRSVVVFYGSGVEDFSNAKAEYLGHFAENDPYEPPSNVEALEVALQARRAAGNALAIPGHRALVL